MTFINNMNRAELEIAVLENNLEDSLFGGFDNLFNVTDDEMREKLTQWVIEGDETAN